MTLIAKHWKDYELLDAGSGERLERWGDIVLRRPDPQIIWPADKSKNLWQDAHAHHHRSKDGGGHWDYLKNFPKQWTINYKSLSFHIQLGAFKHTGLFPEQAVNWDWMIDKVKSAGRPIRVLNLFAYTGGATVALASAGAEVCHVDSAKAMVARAKDNLALSGLAEQPVRFIVDDVLKFVKREQRRSRVYDAVVMDPPSYGRGTSGEMWKLEDSLYELIKESVKVLSDRPLFFLINSYTTGLSPTVLENVLSMAMQQFPNATLTSGEIALPISTTKLLLPCGIYGRWEESSAKS